MECNKESRNKPIHMQLIYHTGSIEVRWGEGGLCNKLHWINFVAIWEKSEFVSLPCTICKKLI